jgi:hypothetical protein
MKQHPLTTGMRLRAAAILVCLMAGLGGAVWGAENSTRRLGVFIGSNNGGAYRSLLRYAVSDARAVSRVFTEMGGVRGADNILLVEPDVRGLEQAIDQVHGLIREARQTAKRTELVFYYSGHSDEQGLLLGRERYAYQDLRERINRIPSDMRIVILDSCASGAFTRAKGGAKTQPFLMDSSVSVEGYAFLTSSSAAESSQESDRIEGSYFTHNLVAGLRGAADTVGDGQVTLNEVYRFAYAETLAVTETSLYGAQHPSYDMQVSGSGDVVLTNVRENSASLLIEAPVSGRLSIRDGQDHLIAEISKINGKSLELGLETGAYRIVLQQGDSFYRASLFLLPNAQTRLATRDFVLIAASPATARGDPEEAEPELQEEEEAWEFDFDFGFESGSGSDGPLVHDPVSLQFGPGLPPRSDSVRVSTNLLIGLGPQVYGLHGLGIGLASAAVEHEAHGIVAAGLVSVAGGSMHGIAAAGLVNAGGSMFGIRAAGLVNAGEGEMRGAQAASLANVTGGNTYGIQAAGLANVGVKDVYGISAAGLANVAGRDMYGVQASALANVVGGDLYGVGAAGLVNLAGRDMYGVQASALGNVNGGDSGGIQAAGLFNAAGGTLYGIQTAALFNAAGVLDGIQAAGLFNVAGKTNWYDHKRLYNAVGDLFRWQFAGVFNAAGDEFYGIQAAPVNISGRNSKSGLHLQAGIVNISQNERVIPLGLVNVVKNGILHPAFYYDAYRMFNVSFRSGSKYMYSLFSAASDRRSLEGGGGLLALRAGLGFELLFSRFFLDIDLAAGVLFASEEVRHAEKTYTKTIQARASLGFSLFKHLGIFAGVSYDCFDRQNPHSPLPDASGASPLASPDNERLLHTLAFFAGLQF